MSRLFKAITVLLIPALAIASSGPSAWADAAHVSNTAMHEQVGESCHSDGGFKSPASDSQNHSPASPVSYKCCLIGHTAIVLVRSANFSHLVVSHVQAGGQIPLPETGASLNPVRIPAVCSADPPHTPLRI
jgi:hypothetical protein